MNTARTSLHICAETVPSRGEIDAVRHDLLAWLARQRDGLIRSRALCIASNLELDPSPLPILSAQVEQLAALVGRKAKM